MDGQPSGPRAGITFSLESGFVYTYDIPQVLKEALAKLLDVNNNWYTLGKNQMSYTTAVLDNIQSYCERKGTSPAETLLDKWGNCKHTYTELFMILSHENFYNCMKLIKNLVEPRYHHLIREPDITELSETTGRPENSSFTNELADLTGLIPQISYEELTVATENWSERYILGKGGFGTVFLGFFKHTCMAIKKIDYNKVKCEAERIQLQQSFNELRYLNSCRHDNIVPLFGYSLDNVPCLVYQFMPGGSLDKSLFARRPVSLLTWKERMNIAYGTAKGLQYLHTFGEKPFIHGDIKPGNILLNEFKQPRIGDFGLTRQGAAHDSAMVVSRAYGTRPYVPKELYYRNELSTKIDTYSFGVVLYEIGTGLRAWDERRTDKHLKDYIARAVREKADVSELADKSLPQDEVALRSCYKLLRIGHQCTADDPKQRPDMVTVMKELGSL